MSMYIRLVFDLPAGVCSEKDKIKKYKRDHIFSLASDLQI